MFGVSPPVSLTPQLEQDATSMTVSLPHLEQNTSATSSILLRSLGTRNMCWRHYTSPDSARE